MACAVLMIVLAGCSEDDPVAPPAPPSGGLGTPLTGMGAIEAQSPLFWSFTADEIVAVASFNDPNSNSLIAVASTTGATRQLEPVASSPLSLTPDGAGVYYVTLELDSTVARSVELMFNMTRRRLNRCDGGGCFHVVLPAPLAVDQVAIYPVADSTALQNVSTGARQMLTSGYPLAFSLDGTRLLKKEVNEPIQDALIFDIGAGTSLPANLGLPDEIGDYLVRWTTTGIEVLYQTLDRKDLVLRRAGPGQDAIVFSTPDTLEVAMDWKDERIAVWTSKAAGAGRSYELTVIHGSASLVGVNRVATTTLTPGRPVLPPDGSDQIVYAVDRRLYRSTYTPPVEGAPR